jgi:hypothetical protein
MPRRLLVLGATGALRPAALALASSGATVIAWARRPEGLTSFAEAAQVPVALVAVDYHDACAVALALAELTAAAPLDGALLYCPDAHRDVVAAFSAAVDGPVVCLVPSSAAQPVADTEFDLAAVDVPAGSRRLVMGWVEELGVARWHTPEEISAAALEVLSTGRDSLLGHIRPWHHRPT